MTVSDFRAEIILVSEQTEGNWVWDDATKDFIWVPRAVQSRKLFIKSVDPVQKTITLKFRGAKAGEHVISIYSIEQESKITLLDELTIVAGAKVTGITPNSGSLLGGTQVTITGENFSDNIQDNPVIIGDAECIVSSSSATEIQC